VSISNNRVWAVECSETDVKVFLNGLLVMTSGFSKELAQRAGYADSAFRAVVAQSSNWIPDFADSDAIEIEEAFNATN
jgi:hypothetical protein